MTKFGDDVAFSLGGGLPSEPVNGLPAQYKRMREPEAVVYAVVAFRTAYVKTYAPGSDHPNEPVLAIIAVEPGTGDDELLLVDLLGRLRDGRVGGQQGMVQGEFEDPERDLYRAWFEGEDFDPGMAKALELAWLAGREDLDAHPGEEGDEATAEGGERFAEWIDRMPTGFPEPDDVVDLMRQAWTAGREHKIDHAGDPEDDGAGERPEAERGGHLAIAPPTFSDGDTAAS